MYMYKAHVLMSFYNMDFAANNTLLQCIFVLFIAPKRKRTKEGDIQPGPAMHTTSQTAQVDKLIQSTAPNNTSRTSLAAASEQSTIGHDRLTQGKCFFRFNAASKPSKRQCQVEGTCIYIGLLM